MDEEQASANQTMLVSRRVELCEVVSRSRRPHDRYRCPDRTNQMAIPDKHDRLSATIASDLKINGVQCEVACYGSENDFVCRITQQNMKPVAAEGNDGYHPPSDGGLLWIRSIDDQCLITGVVQKHLFPSSDKLHNTLDSIQQMLTVDQAQSKVNVTVLGNNSIQSLEFNGEQIDTHYD